MLETDNLKLTTRKGELENEIHRLGESYDRRAVTYHQAVYTAFDVYHTGSAARGVVVSVRFGIFRRDLRGWIQRTYDGVRIQVQKSELDRSRYLYNSESICVLL